MNKWLYRTVGAVGVAGGICLVASGAAHANEAGVTPNGGPDAAQPAAKPQLVRDAVEGLLKPLAAPLSGDRLTGHDMTVLPLDNSGQPAAATTPRTEQAGDQAPDGRMLARQVLPEPRTLPVQPGSITYPALAGRSPATNSGGGVNGNGVGVVLAGGMGEADAGESPNLLALPPNTPTASVPRGALGTTEFASSGRRAESLPMLPQTSGVLDQVTLNGRPLTQQKMDSLMLFKPTVAPDTAGQAQTGPLTSPNQLLPAPADGPTATATTPVSTTRSSRPSPRPRTGERPVAGVDTEYR